MKIEINPNIESALRRKFVLPSDLVNAKLYLMSLYFNLNSKLMFSSYAKQKVEEAGIIKWVKGVDLNEELIWAIPLFKQEESSIAFEWVETWMDGFKKINPTRKGTKISCVSRMKKFFSENPAVRVDDVFAATQLYFRTVDNPTYLKSSHKFIYEGTGFSLNSMLLQYVEMLKESNAKDGRVSKVKI